MSKQSKQSKTSDYQRSLTAAERRVDRPPVSSETAEPALTPSQPLRTATVNAKPGDAFSRSCSNSLGSSTSRRADDERLTEPGVQASGSGSDKTSNQISKFPNSISSDKAGRAREADRTAEQSAASGPASKIPNVASGEPCTIAGENVSQPKSQQPTGEQPGAAQPPPAPAVECSKTSKPGGIFRRFSGKSKPVSVSNSAPLSSTSDHHTVVFSFDSNQIANYSQSSNLQSSTSNPQSSSTATAYNSSTTIHSTPEPSAANHPAGQSGPQQANNHKKTKKRRSFELFNSGIIRRQHSAHQSSQSSPGPVLSSSQSEQQRRESVSSPGQPAEPLPLATISAGLPNSSVTNAVGGGQPVQQPAAAANQVTQLDPTNVASSSGSIASTPALPSVAQIATRVGFARRFLNRSKTSGLLVGGSSSEHSRPHSRTIQDIFRGEMSVRRPRGSFRNSLHRFGSAEATLRRPVRHHAWAFKDGEW